MPEKKKISPKRLQLFVGEQERGVSTRTLLLTSRHLLLLNRTSPDLHPVPIPDRATRAPSSSAPST